MIEYNLLIIGMAGSGKKTLINSIANHFENRKYSDPL